MNLRDRLYVARIRFADEHPKLWEALKYTVFLATTAGLLVPGTLGIICVALLLPIPDGVVRGVLIWRLLASGLLAVVLCLAKLAQKFGYSTM